LKKLNVLVLFGGISGEHEVSLTSAKNIISSLDPGKYNPVLVGIDKSGKWHYYKKANYLLNETDPKLISLSRSNIEVSLSHSPSENNLISLNENLPAGDKKIDVAIPVLHGPFGEDGTIQGLLEMAGIPYVGSDVLGSAIGMDKDVMKRLLREAGIDTPKFVVFNKTDYEEGSISYSKISKHTGIPFFVKPANLGSSLGISKVKSEKDFAKDVKEAFRFDLKVIFEEAITGREIECSVLGNDNPRASLPGEIIPSHEFYSYDAKYIDENGAELETPAKLSKVQIARVQDLSIRVFKVLCAKGLARVDFFLTPEGNFLCNEINTFPGFTKISMYPKLWEATGISFSELIDTLIELAIERISQKKKLSFSK